MVHPLWRRLFRRRAETPPAVDDGAPPVWEERQRQVIDAPPTARLWVEGGPGTGKTAIACARAARLREDIATDGGSLWLISFTRTAIREIRDRIAHARTRNHGATRGEDERLWVLTLDALAWRLIALDDFQDPEEGREAEEGSHDRTVTRALASIRQGALASRLARLRHVLIDEAHDIVGPRAELVLALFEALPDQCGITLFADPAQAIYGFAQRGRLWTTCDLSLPPAGPVPWRKIRLETLFRARTASLPHLFHAAHALVLDETLAPRRRLTRLRRLIRRTAAAADGGSSGNGDAVAALIANHAPAAPGQGMVPADLILYRRRAEVLTASDRLLRAGIPHRLRLSGQPRGLAPWIAVLLSGQSAPVLGPDAFALVWERRISGTPFETLSRDDAWAALTDCVRANPAADPGQLDLDALYRVLARSPPPVRLTLAETGDSGPVLGTIHASKGREAGTVHLMLPDKAEGRHGDPAEEARVLYVGATRARRSLRIGLATSEPALRLRSGRIVGLNGSKDIRVEFGRDGDIDDAAGLAGRESFANLSVVLGAQARLASLAGQVVALSMIRHGSRFFLCEAASLAPLAAISPAIEDDFDEIVRRTAKLDRRLHRPDRIDGIWLIGLRTQAVAPGSAQTSRLHAPWSRGGLLLAPLFTGYAPISLSHR